jgi:3',5'-nucleoside bisphosphate phosphatase
MLAKLRERGIEIDAADVRRTAGAATATGRPHVADALVELGAVRDREEAFARYLSAGKPAYVDRYAAPLADMVDIVAGAGGVAVIAHPWGRHERTSLDESALAELAERGLAGIEVDHEDHDEVARRDLRAIARNLGLVATGSSDHHGAGKTGHDLGCNTTDPDEFDRLVELARASAERSGREVPALVSGA